MQKVVHFYYGIGSRYSFLASTRMGDLERETGCGVVWRPLYSPELLRRRGADPFRQPLPSGQYDAAYRNYDARCWAAFYGIAYNEPKVGVKEHDRYARSCVAADRLGACSAFTTLLFAAIFGEGRDVIDDGELRAIGDAVGVDGALLLRLIDDGETRARHDQNIEEALAAGAFGVPTFVSDGRLFGGNDRLLLLRDFLTRSDPEAYPVRTP